MDKIVLNMLLIYSLMISFPLAFVVMPSVGLKKYRKLLAEDISKKRNIVGESCITNALLSGIHTLTLKGASSFGLLFFTEAGMEFYSGLYSIRKQNFYLPWKNIISISLKQGGRLVVELNDKQKKQIFVIRNRKDLKKFKSSTYNIIKSLIEDPN